MWVNEVRMWSYILWGLPTVESKAGSPPWVMRISATPSPFRSGSTAGL